jgi:hypothetical protein
MLTQSVAAGAHFDAVVVATGSGGTQGGLVAGMLLYGGLPVIGIAVEGTRRAGGAGRPPGNGKPAPAGTERCSIRLRP